MVVRAGTEQEETESSDKKNGILRFTKRKNIEERNDLVKRKGHGTKTEVQDLVFLK